MTPDKWVALDPDPLAADRITAGPTLIIDRAVMASAFTPDFWASDGREQRIQQMVSMIHGAMLRYATRLDDRANERAAARPADHGEQ